MGLRRHGMAVQGPGFKGAWGGCLLIDSWQDTPLSDCPNTNTMFLRSLESE